MKIVSKHPFLVAAVILFSVHGVFAQTASATAKNFYSVLAGQNIRGLPDQAHLAHLSPYLSKEIITLIRRNQRKQAAFIKKHPDEKPPWIEGDLFSSLFEGRTSFRMGRSRRFGTATHVDIELEYEDGRKPSYWTDTAVLKRMGGKWRITNILYKGKWQFKSRSLLDALK